MKSNFHLIFYLKKQKNYQGGAAAIYMRLTVNGKRSEISTGRECQPEKWNSSAGRAIGTKAATRLLNDYLDGMQHNVRIAHQELLDKGKVVTVDSLRKRFTGESESQHYLMKLLASHNAEIQALIGNGFEANTLKGYKTSEKHLAGYLKKQYKQTDIEVNELNHAFITGFEFYLKADCKCSGVSAAKYIKHLKKIVNNCLANKWLIENPFIKYKQSAKAKERTFLTKEELDAIANCKKITIERLLNVRDIFVFCCYTGLSYADVKKLKRNEIGIGLDGEQWIFTSRQKTDTASRIPLLPAAQKIMAYYKDHPQCDNKGLVLPVLSNQKMNAYLKEVADLSGVSKHLTFHLARHTFATTVTLANGVPIESVSKMLGHTDIKTTQHYAKVLDIKVSQDMAALKQKFA